ncbi:BamA/TamA family outer membrane protein [Paraflavitalea sp. CAU 1676]|uniref:autotransporter assembly complex protein TamA n=1 Tax=Paraflavitalea sp. CAU 1676 TaxID=3032598 RepID=UPI0023DADCB6|nr:BamA/TamA family outer membrane protein [Paraflavitalea sp. CAU 1676]MDF2187203.1 BamA/TamA family outer membrane protein [Paraflavitalea sp. CAU 1676]
MMAKVAVYRHMGSGGIAIILLLLPCLLSAQYRLKINSVDKDSIFIVRNLRLQTDFRNGDQCVEYVNALPAVLGAKGYPAASVDSVIYDSLSASLQLYVGEPLQWARLNMDSVDRKILEQLNWANRKGAAQKPVDFNSLQNLQQRILDYLENNGHPFARVRLDSINVQGDAYEASLKVDKGPLYRIDSITNKGSAKLSDVFLQHYLGIPNGSVFRKDRLQTISKKIHELPYVQEQQSWDLTMLGTGSILNVYLAPKKSSQVNVLVGFLPASDQTVNNKLLVTGEATINLKNALGGGETIGLNWQQVQVKSPRLNIVFAYPYLFNSPFGINFGFDLFKKDSSFVNISLLLGLQYALAANKTGSVYLQNLTSNLLTVDTFQVKNSRKLPTEADVRSVNIGVNYEWFNTDYRYNPRRGNEFLINLSAGTKKINKNSSIVKLRDEGAPDFDFNSLYDTVNLNAYQFRVKLAYTHYFRLTRASALKLGVSGGWFESPSIFRNELFQIGGYRLLRGFDEESIFASRYAVSTLEYRYLLGQNSFLFAFTDLGWAKNSVPAVNVSNAFLGVGLGMAFETKAGIFNISYAAGKRDDAKFNLRQSKIHLGYVNYF